MKARFQHSIHFLLAVLVLVSTQSYSINAHYCGNILVDKAIMKPAQKCAMHNEHSPTNHEQPNKKDNCCNDEVELIEGQDQLKIQSSHFELPHPIFVEALVFTYFTSPSYETEASIPFYENPPPLLKRDFQAFFQVYLI